MEQSASYMADVQSYLSWLVGGILHRLRELQPETFNNNSMLNRMLRSLTTAVFHLASETFGLLSMAVVRRRKLALSFFPRGYSAKDRGVLRATSWDDATPFTNQVVSSVDERSASRSSRSPSTDRLPGIFHQGRDIGRQRQPQAPSSTQQQHGSTSQKPPSFSSARQSYPRRKEALPNRSLLPLVEEIKVFQEGQEGGFFGDWNRAPL